jgi:hypothetical protein
MTPQIKLQKQHLADLQCIREMGETELFRIVTELNKLPIAPLQPKELLALISRVLNGNSTVADVLLRQLLSLHGMRRQLGLNSDEVFAGLDSGLRDSDWNESDVKKWQSVFKSFKDLFELPIVRLSATALDLAYQHSHLLQRTQIITDVRPLFNDQATEIQGTIISHKLLVRYDDLEGEHALSLAVDDRDIEALIKQCERALKKAQTAKDQLSFKAGLTTIIPGKE